MLYLCRCAVCVEPASAAAVSGMDLPKVFARCCEHSVESMAFEVLADVLTQGNLQGQGELHTLKNSPLIKEWQSRRDSSVRKAILLDAMRSSLYKFLDQIGAWHVSLKGIVLKDLYPKVGMRQMADNDVLFDDKFREQVRDWFVAQGFTVQLYGVSNEDVYLKEPIYNFEMHTRLFDGDRHSDLQRYFENHRGEFLRDEDFYLYLVTHEFMHYRSCGTGIRSLTDRYVYLSHHHLDFDYVQGEAAKIGLAEFELASRLLVQKVFSPDFDMAALNVEEQKMLDYYLTSGTYGTDANGTENALEKKTRATGSKTFGKILFALGRVFPSRGGMAVWCELNAPALKSRWMLPAAYIWRIARSIFVSKTARKTQNEIKRIWKY